LKKTRTRKLEPDLHELEESEERFRALSEASLEGIAIHEQGRILECNTALASLFGYDHDEMVGRNVLDLVAPEARDFVRQKLSSDPGEPYEVLGQRRDGTFFEIQVVARMVHYRGKLARVTTVRDVTERRHAEQEMEERNTYLNALLDNTPLAVVVLDENHRVQLVNPAFEALFQFTAAEAAGRDLDRMIRPNSDEGAQAMREITRGVLSGRTVHGIGVRHRKDGTPVEVEIHGVPLLAKGRLIGVYGLYQDVTERKLAEEAVRQSERHYRSLFENANDAILILEPETETILEANSSAEELYGVARGALVGQSLKRFTRDVTRGEEQVRELLRKGRFQNFATVHYRSDGELLDILVSASVIEHAGKTAILVVNHDVTEVKGAARRIEHLSSHDALTGLANRSCLLTRLDSTIESARTEGYPVALLFLDIDRFGVVNDSLGNRIGDLLLRKVADRLSEIARGIDMLARPGGDEFLLALGRLRSPDDLVLVEQRIRELFLKPFAIGGRELFVTASMGSAVFPDDGADAEELLNSAHIALDRAKRQGSDSYQRHTSGMSETTSGRLSLEIDLRKAIERGGLEVHYQPQVDVVSGRVVGVEALARWTHPERGPIPPAEFIPLAEETGLIEPLGALVLRTACAQAARWRAEGRGTRVAVNLSGRQFRRRDLPEQIARVLAETGLDPALLDLEITESVAMEDAEASGTVLFGLKALGVRVSLDDFGTGYSSLAYLKKLPIDALKLGAGFVREVTVNANDAAIARATFVLAHELNLRVIAEGVEHAEQLAFLKRHACDEYQGFLFSRAVPAEEAASTFTPAALPLKAAQPRSSTVS